MAIKTKDIIEKAKRKEVVETLKVACNTTSFKKYIRPFINNSAYDLVEVNGRNHIGKPIKISGSLSNIEAMMDFKQVVFVEKVGFYSLQQCLSCIPVSKN